MSVPNSTNKVSYTLTSGAQALSVPFYFLENAHIRAVKAATTTTPALVLVLGTDYTLTGAANPAGGTLTTIVTDANGLEAGSKVVIKRSVPFDQLITYTFNDAFPSQTHEKGLDKATMLAQQLKEQADRAVRVAEDDPASMELPAASERANKAVGFDEDGALVMKTAADGDTLESESVGQDAIQREFRVRRVNSIAALRALSLTGVQAYDRVKPIGYYAPGDGGGGPERFLVTGAAPGTYVDNGGSIIVPTGGDGSAAWLWEWSGPVNVRWFGAKGDGVADDTAAINAAVAALGVNGGRIGINRGEYRITDAVNLCSNLFIDGETGAKLKLGSGIVDKYMVRGVTVDNVKIIGLEITGNGSAGYNSVYLSSSTNVIFDRCTITKAGGLAIQLTSCSNVTVRHCDLSSNYYYGVEDRDGTNNHYLGCTCDSNGNTGVAISVGGRGIVLWRCTGCFVDNCRFVGNSEYGFRLYSEAADTGKNRGNVVTNCYFEDNTRADLVIYDESQTGSLVLQNIVSNVVIRRSSVPTLAVSVLYHGGDNILDNVQVFHTGTLGAYTAFQLYYGVRNKLNNCTAHNVQDAVRFSNETNCVVDNFYGQTVATACGPGGVQGSGNVIRNSRFVHGGAGASDVGIVNYDAAGRNYYEGLVLDGFHTGIYIDDETVTIRDCRTLNSTSAGLRKDSDAQAGQEIIDNIWDSTNPALIQYLERRSAGNAVLYASAAPTIRTWAVGDRCINSSPVVGQPKAWVCTVAGTPGTWVSEGNL